MMVIISYESGTHTKGTNHAGWCELAGIRENLTLAQWKDGEGSIYPGQTIANEGCHVTGRRDGQKTH
jgi:hypothetical protein